MAKKRILILSTLFMLICVVSILITNIYKMWYLEGFVDNKQETYANNEFLQYDGGAAAMAFFPQNDNLQNWDDVYFHYQDNRAKSTLLHRYYSFFLLDVRYSEEEYNSFTQQFDYDPKLGLGGYSKVMQDSSVDSYCKGIYCNDAENTVRYIVFYGNFAKSTSLDALVIWNASNVF